MTDFNDKLNFCWEQYLKMINLFVTLTSGTFIIIMTIVTQDLLKSVSKCSKILGFIGLIFLFSALCSVIIWRIYAQAGMEKEILGSKDNLDIHIEGIGIGSSITHLTTNPIKLSKNIRFFKWLYGIFLMTSWILFMVYVFLMIFLTYQ
jgi:hypothetical protein